MCNKGYLVANGHGRGTRYYLPGQGNIGSNLGSNIGSKTKRRMSREKLYKAILDICAEWISLEDIAETLGYNADYLSTSIISSMLNENLIERMFPQARHPNQKYKKVDKG